MRRFIAFGPALVVLIATLVTLVAAPAAVRMVGYAATDAQVQSARVELERDSILKQIDRAVRAIAEAVEPSVVHVGIEAPVRGGGGFGRMAQGSGWVYDDKGHIITNAHVVRDAPRIVVQFHDGRASDAEVIGLDQATDIAVLRVKSVEGIVPANRASGLEMRQGDRVYAFGSPFGFKFSMSEGIVSGLGRDPSRIIGQGGYTNFIQTDAAVNPGNSGGPLVNVEGKVVGMNVAIATAPGTSREEGQNSGISFAIPLMTIERVADQLISGGLVARGYMGISQAFNDDANARELVRLGYRGRGVAIMSVVPDAPAAKAGFRSGDIVTRINDTVVDSIPVLRSAIANNAPGDRVKIEFWRDGESKTETVVLGRLISDAELREAALAATRFGLNDMADTNDGQVYVTEVRVPSAAYAAGLRPRFRVTAVESQPIGSLSQFFSSLASAGLHQGREVLVQVETPSGEKRDIRINGR